MAKWVKGKYKIRKQRADGGLDWPEVEGAVNGQWGIDKRDQYYLTHIPSGCRVESARTQRFLKELTEEPEFQRFDMSWPEMVGGLVTAINRKRKIDGWKA